MPRGIAPKGAPAPREDHFRQCLNVVHRLYKKVYGQAAARRNDPLLVDFADKLAGRRYGEWLIARRLWEQARGVQGTPAQTKQFHQVFYRQMSPEESRQYTRQREAYRFAVESLRARLEGANLELTVKGRTPASDSREARSAAKGLGRLLHQDQTGQLWEVPLPGRSPLLRGERGIRLVRMVDVQPEADGTHPVRWLFVPPEVDTAREAVAWTFGVNPAHYWPTQQA